MSVAASAPSIAVSSVLATRVATAAVLVAAVLAALFLLPPYAWGVVVLAVVTAAAREWGELIGLAGATIPIRTVPPFGRGRCLLHPPIPAIAPSHA